jgi:hypothetical protein
MYMLSAGQEPGAPNDPELQSIIQSFRLLSAAEPGPLNVSSKSAAYRAGELVGKALIFVTIPCGLLVVGVIVWLAIRRG